MVKMVSDSAELVKAILKQRQQDHSSEDHKRSSL